MENQMHCHDSRFQMEQSDLNMDAKQVLLLQGPVGLFFRKVSQVLRQEGHRTMHVCLTFPDYFWSGADDIRKFRGKRGEFNAYLDGILSSETIDYVLVMGCERFAHRVALAACAKRGIPVLCLEEGYIRPGFVTAEWMGNNRHSPIRELSDEDLRNEPEPADLERGTESRLNLLVISSILHFLLRAFGHVFFGRQLLHQKRRLISEGFYWLRNFARKNLGHGRNKRAIDNLLKSHPGKFYVLPLQVADDMQLVEAGMGWSNETLSKKTLISFSKHAPDDHQLLIKVHPFDRGHPSPRPALYKLACELGIAERVLVVDDGNLGKMTKLSSGMITINSTSGLMAIQNSIPLAVAGDTLYARRSLCFSIENDDDLDKFWTQAKPAEPEIAAGFRRAVLNRSLLPGNFYSHRDSHLAAKAVVGRLINSVPSVQTQANTTDRYGFSFGYLKPKIAR